MKKILSNTLLIAAVIALSSCLQEPELTEPSSGDANTDKFVAVGDSYLSGYQDGALYADGQSRSIAALFSVQLQTAGSNAFVQTIVQDNQGIGINSKPWEYLYNKASVMGIRVDCEGEESLGPVKAYHTGGSESTYLTSQSAAGLTDFTFPFLTAKACLNNQLDTTNVFYARVSASLGSGNINSHLTTSSPTFFMSWLGMEEIYSYARNGGYLSTIPSALDFKADYDSVLTALTSNGGSGIIATIPSLEYFPFYTLIPIDGASLTLAKADSLNDIYDQSGLGHIVFQEGDNPFIIDDVNAQGGVRQLQSGEHITISVPLDSMKCYFYGLLFSTIHDRYVLDSAEMTLINNSIIEYNQAIRDLAMTYNLAIVEMDDVFTDLESGMKWNGQDFNLEFVTGGFFSLDGFHVNQKGAAILANAFISSMNLHFNASIPPTNCPECNGILFP